MTPAGVWMLAASLLLQGCVESRPTMLGAPISGINHTSAAINQFSVNGGGGPNLGPYGGGPGSQMCCAMLPVQWREGLAVVVEWEMVFIAQKISRRICSFSGVTVATSCGLSGSEVTFTA